MATPPTPVPGHTGFAVSVADVASTAVVFGRVHVSAGEAMADTARALSGSTGMGGDDAETAEWRTRYDVVARQAWAACTTSVRTLHDVAARLVESGDAYLAAEHASTPGASGGPERLPAVSHRIAAPGGPPSPTGPGYGAATIGTDVPGLADLVRSLVPSGDPERLRAAGTAWSGLAERLDDAALDADKAFRTLTAHNTGAGFSAMSAFWTARYAFCATDPLFNVAPIGARTLGRVCSALGDLIDRTRTAIVNAANDAADSADSLKAVQAVPEVGELADAALQLGLPARVVTTIRAAQADFADEVDDLAGQLSVGLADRLGTAASSPGGSSGPVVTAADVGEVAGLGLRGSGWDQLSGDRPTPDSVHITAERRLHVLDGDGPGKTGGGHRHGTGKPNKSEFPAGWTDEHVIQSVMSVARDPDPGLDYEFQKNGNWKVHGVREGVLIEVIVRPDGHVVTSYPVSGPGVVRNPPAPR